MKKTLDLPELSPHKLRHSYATYLIKSNVNISIVKELLGHENLSTTQIYTHVTFDSIRRSYETSHPRAKKNQK